MFVSNLKQSEKDRGGLEPYLEPSQTLAVKGLQPLTKSSIVDVWLGCKCPLGLRKLSNLSFMITCSATLCFIRAKTSPLCNVFIFYTHFIILKVLFVEKKNLNPNLGRGMVVILPPTCWFSLNNYESLQAVTLAFPSIQQHFIRDVRAKFGIPYLPQYTDIGQSSDGVFPIFGFLVNHLLKEIIIMS